LEKRGVLVRRLLITQGKQGFRAADAELAVRAGGEGGGPTFETQGLREDDNADTFQLEKEEMAAW